MVTQLYPSGHTTGWGLFQCVSDYHADVIAFSTVNIRTGIAVGIQHEGIATLHADFLYRCIELTLERGEGIVFCLREQTLGFFLELQVLLQQFLQLCLTLVEDGWSEGALVLEKGLVFGVELVFRLLQFVVILVAQLVHVGGSQLIVGHRLEGFVITEISELEILCLSSKSEEGNEEE